MEAQSLADHQWKDRILIVYANDPESEALTRQRKTLAKCVNGLEERRLVTYFVTDTEAQQVESGNMTVVSRDLFDKVISNDLTFETILIGLDGGIKRRYTKPVSCDDVFRLIDSMPMRRSEIKKQN